ncbi:MAG: SulP family inorganic anion transporter [Saprospiraceae bacterium]|nr:SulP family inorganic anion transporter [Saprospiraceae bacterium]
MQSESLTSRLKLFINPFDKRYEDLVKGNVKANIFKDLMAGLVVAMVAIPLAMGFAMASGLRPEQGIVGGAVAGLLGALFGGSKYQVYGPTAAYIPIIGGLMATYSHSFLVMVSIVAGILLLFSGIFKFGRFVTLVPHSIVVGFTIGIAIVIAFSQMGEVFGFKNKIGYAFIEQIQKTISYLPEMNVFAMIVALLTFAICKILISYSKLIPAPVIGLGFGYIAAKTFWSDKGLVLIKDKYGSIPTDFSVFTPPVMPEFTGAVMFDLVYFAFAIYIVAAIESLLCSRMADRLANNKGTPFNPDKELWGQGWVNIVTPLFNGFPHTGALARTAVNIKLGALSPLSGIAKFAFKLLLAAFLAKQLELVPMACIGGILLYVASGMVKKHEIQEVLDLKNKYHFWLMIFTAVMVPLTGFLWAVLSAIGVFIIMVAMKWVENPINDKVEHNLDDTFG